jgi:hypothetical protein
VRQIAEAAGWWAGLMLAWIATMSTISVPELTVGAGCALLCAVVAVVARRAIGQRWRADKRWLTWLGPLVLAVPADTARLLGRALPGLLRHRGSTGRLRRAEPPGGEDPERAAGRQAWGTLAVSATPGSVILDWPPDGRPAVIHDLGSGPPQMDEVVMR